MVVLHQPNQHAWLESSIHPRARGSYWSEFALLAVRISLIVSICKSYMKKGSGGQLTYISEFWRVIRVNIARCIVS